MENETLSVEDRLKGIMYGFVDLQDGLKSDRLEALKQRREADELLKSFEKQVDEFKTLTPKMQQKFAEIIIKASNDSAEKVGEVVQKAASKKIEKTTEKLKEAVHLATHRLNAYENKIDKYTLLFMVLLFLATIATGFMVARLAAPTPYLALTGEQLDTYHAGKFLKEFWPKLSQKEKDKLKKLADEPARNADGKKE